MTDAVAEKTLEEELQEALTATQAADTATTAGADSGVDAAQRADTTVNAQAGDANASSADDGEQTGPVSNTNDESQQPVIPDPFGVPPSYAKKAIKDNWANFSPEVRKELHEREKEVHRQFTTQDEERNFGKRVKEVVGPYEGFIRQLGADPVQAVDYLIKTDYALRTAPPEQRKALLLKAARDYGIDLTGEVNGDYQQNVPQDPRVETLEQRLQRLEFERQSDIQARQLAEQRSIEQQIADFSSKPENVFFDRVSPMMAALIQSGQAQNLEQAYEMAVYADPETRELQLAAKQQAQQSAAIQTQKAAAEKARAASASVTGAPGNIAAASSPVSNGSLEDDIRAAIAASTERI